MSEDIYVHTWITNPHILHGQRGQIAVIIHHIGGKRTPLLLVLVVEDEDGELGAFARTAQLLGGGFHILLEFSHGVLESCARVVDFIYDEDVAADEI